MSTTTATYTRGTATTKITTAKLAATPGTWVLTVDATDERKAALAAADYADFQTEVSMAGKKIGSTLRQVERAEAVVHPAGTGYRRRAQRSYVIHFTDGTQSRGHFPANTWDRVEAPAVETPAPAVETPAPAATGEQVLGYKLATGHRVTLKGIGPVLVSAATRAGRKVTVAWIADGVTGTTEVWASSRFRLAA